MARPVRPSSLLWGLFLALGGTALVLRLRVPGHWALHVSTVYSVLWMIGLYVTLKQRPHQIDETFVSLHMGLLGALRVRSDQILAAAPFPEFDDDWVKREYMTGMPKLLRTGAPAVELRLAGPVACTGVMGPSSRRYDRVAVSVDDPSAFLAALGHPCA